MVKELPKQALQHIVDRPKHLDLMTRSGNGAKYVGVALALKNMDRSKALRYDIIEYEREFGKYGINYLRLVAKKMGLTKVRMAKDDGNIYIWSNDER